MSVLLYKGAKYRTLAGKKIFHNGEWIELPASAKMYLNGQWYPLGRTVPGSSIPDITVIQPAPSMSLDVETGQVTAEYTPVAGLVEDTSKKSSTLQLETLAGQTITPGSSAQTIAGG